MCFFFLFFLPNVFQNFYRSLWTFLSLWTSFRTSTPLQTFFTINFHSVHAFLYTFLFKKCHRSFNYPLQTKQTNFHLPSIYTSLWTSLIYYFLTHLLLHLCTYFLRNFLSPQIKTNQPLFLLPSPQIHSTKQPCFLSLQKFNQTTFLDPSLAPACHIHSTNQQAKQPTYPKIKQPIYLPPSLPSNLTNQPTILPPLSQIRLINHHFFHPSPKSNQPTYQHTCQPTKLYSLW